MAPRLGLYVVTLLAVFNGLRDPGAFGREDNSVSSSRKPARGNQHRAVDRPKDLEDQARSIVAKMHKGISKPNLSTSKTRKASVAQPSSSHSPPSKQVDRPKELEDQAKSIVAKMHKGISKSVVSASKTRKVSVVQPSSAGSSTSSRSAVEKYAFEQTTRSPNPCKLFTEEHIQYTVDRIMQVTINSNPYPHFHLTEVFHPEVYECMMARLPKSDNIYSTLESQSVRSTVSLREIVNNTVLRGPYQSERKKTWVKVPDDSKDIDVPFWTMWSDAFSRPEISNAYLTKMLGTLSMRPAFSKLNLSSVDLVERISKNLHWNMGLTRDVTGYEIGPHTDADRKHITILYYLPKADAEIPKNAGTCVMRSKTGLTQDRGSTRRTFDQFTIVEQAHFEPNSVFVFAACDRSWHAVKREKTRFVRDTIQAFLLSNDGDKGGQKGKCPKSKSDAP